MLYQNTVFLPTQRFYEVPQYAAYNDEKQAHLVRLDPQYSTKSTHEKWSFLITRLTESLTSAEDMPRRAGARLNIAAFQQTLNAFKATRETTSNSLFNLSLEKCVSYFEDFYFLYTTDDPRFKLTPDAKKALLQSMDEAIGTCETGINGRFYTVLQDHQKDTDWIQDELTKARCQALRQLKAGYDAQYVGAIGMDVHVYDTLVKFANQEQFGITVNTTILDIHAGMMNTQQIKTYFDEHSIHIFNTYEKQARATLTNQYLAEIASVLSISSTDWEKGPIDIPADKMGDFNRSIETHFNGIDTTGILHGFGEFSDDYSTFTLKPRQQVAKQVEDLVTQKLKADRYYVSFDDIEQNRADRQTIRPKKGTRLDDLIAMYQAAKANDVEGLSKNPHLLIDNPELILSQIHTNPAILSRIPAWLKMDTRFVDAAMVTLDQLLCDAIARNDEACVRQLTGQVFDLIQYEHGYLQQLSTPVLTNQTVAALVREKTRSPKLRERAAYDRLLARNEISLAEFMACVDSITPQRLLLAIDQRNHKRLPPLPFFSNEDAVQVFRQFNQDIQDKLAPDWSQSYLSIKRRACEQEDFAFMRQPYRFNNAVTYIARTNDWFTGFRQYHAYQSSAAKNVLRLVIAARALLDMIISMIKIALWISALVLFIEYLDDILVIAAGLAMLVIFSIWLINGFVQSPVLATIADALWRIVELRGQILGYACLQIVGEIYNSCVALIGTFDAASVLLETLFNAFAFKAPECSPQSVEDMCDYTIVRLEGIDEASAQQKSDILKTLRALMQQEKRLTPERPFQDLLDQEYRVSYQGREYQVSFSEVASTSRPHYSAFHIDSPPVGMMGFFKRQTTTEQLLASVEPAMATGI